MLKLTCITLLIWTLLISVKGQTGNCSFLHNLYNYQSGIKVKKSIDSTVQVPGYPYLKTNLIKIDLIDSTFNLNQYLKIFDKLSLEDGYKVDYLFFSDLNERSNAGGHLKIYAHQDTSAIEPFVKAEMKRMILFWDSVISSKIEINKVKQDPLFDKKMEKYYMSRNRIDYKYSLNQYLLKDTLYKACLPEKSKEGYFQYLILYLSEKYGMLWNSNLYLQAERIICTMDDLENALNRIRKYYEGYNQDQANKLLQASPEPLVEISDGKCFVTVIVSDWYGSHLLKRHYQINLEDMKITMIKQEVAVNCKAVFFD
jgi:hypothetical protein